MMCFYTCVSQSNILSVVLCFALTYGSRFLRLFLFRETKLANNGTKSVCVGEEMLNFYPLKKNVCFYLKGLLKHFDQDFFKYVNRLLKQKEVNFRSKLQLNLSAIDYELG